MEGDWTTEKILEKYEAGSLLSFTAFDFQLMCILNVQEHYLGEQSAKKEEEVDFARPSELNPLPTVTHICMHFTLRSQ